MAENRIVVPFPTMESALSAIGLHAKQAGLAPADVVALYEAGRLACIVLRPDLDALAQRGVVVFKGYFEHPAAKPAAAPVQGVA